MNETKKEYDKYDWLKNELGALISELKLVLGIKDFNSCSEEEKILFKEVIREEVKRIYRNFDKKGG